jgi:retron-type reverse transcriptase
MLNILVSLTKLNRACILASVRQVAIDQSILLDLLRRRIDDERFIRLIAGMLKAGYMEDWTFHATFSGTPQGGVFSPILAR